MREWTISVSQNSWEYTRIIKITANRVRHAPYQNVHGLTINNRIEVDGAIIEFDEDCEKLTTFCCGKPMDYVNADDIFVCSECCKYENQ